MKKIPFFFTFKLIFPSGWSQQWHLTHRGLRLNITFLECINCPPQQCTFCESYSIRKTIKLIQLKANGNLLPCLNIQPQNVTHKLSHDTF